MFFLIGFLGCVTFIITHKYVLRLQTVCFKRGTKKALLIVKVADPWTSIAFTQRAAKEKLN